MKHCIKTIALFISISCSWNDSLAQDFWKGKVTNSKGQPLEFATINNLDNQNSVFTKSDGTFTLSLDRSKDLIQVEVRYIGMQTISLQFKKDQIPSYSQIALKDLSLSLDEVTINAQFKESNNSNSSIVFNEEAIQAVQAFSMQDIINTLPGKASKAPNLNIMETLTFRGGFENPGHRLNNSGSIGDEYNMNNSLGIAIIMDGINLSNDANMQSKSISRYGLTGGTISSAPFRGGDLGNMASFKYDTPFQGMDLRDIPVNSIEKIEVIQGVASAQYGEATDGAIIIDRKAAASPFNLGMNINAASTNMSLNKGFNLGGKLGALNIGTNYTYSNADPRDRVKSFSRINQSLMWSKQVNNFRNTLSIDYNRRLDNRKEDPDDSDELMSIFKNQGWRFSNRSSLNFKNSVFKNLNLALSYSASDQYTYSQHLLNGPIKPMATKDTIGVYQGYFIPGSYLAIEEITGRPIVASANLNTSLQLKTDEILHQISLGLGTTYTNNGGRGIVSDPNHPRIVGSTGSYDRPYDFQLIPAVYNYSFFIEDQVSAKVANRPFIAHIGLRSDIQNNYLSIQPRVNLRYKISSKYQVTASYGISTKAPTLGHLNPPPIYQDIPLLLHNTGSLDNSIYIVYTDKIIPDNSKLKPAKSSQLEFGLQYQDHFFSSRLYGFYKKSWDGFSTQMGFRSYQLPEYKSEYNAETRQYNYWETGRLIDYNSTTNYSVLNGLSSDIYGLEWSLFTRKIKAIQTSFQMNTSLSLGSYKNQYDYIKPLDIAKVLPNGDKIGHMVYNPQDYNSKQLMTKLSATTHIPKIGFFINVNADLFLIRENNLLANTAFPKAYIINASQRIEIPHYDPNDPIYGDLKLTSSDSFGDRQHLVYTNINMSISKEIRKNMRLSISAYNFFNIRPEKTVHYLSGTTQDYKYNSSPSITATANIKF